MQSYASDTPQAPEEYEGPGLDDFYKRAWREAVDGYADARIQHIRDEEYYDGDVKGTGWGQWTEAQLSALMGRKQPPTTRNITALKVNALCGVEKRTRSEWRAQPRTPKDIEAAEIATDALRYVKDASRWTATKSERVLDAIKVGYAAVEIGGAKDHVPITPIPWAEFFFDPRSQRFDFSDARYLGTAKWLDVDVAIATFAGPELAPVEVWARQNLPPQPMTQDPMQLMAWARMAEAAIKKYQELLDRRQKIVETIESTATGTGSGRILSEEFDDRPADIYCDASRKRIFVIDMWHMDAKKGWFRCVFTGAGKLFTEPAKHMEKDESGQMRPTHPIKAFATHVSKDRWRYGEVRAMRSTQDEVNFRLSKKLHYLATKQLFYVPGTFEDLDRDAVRREIKKPDGVIEVREIDGFKIEDNLEAALAQDAAMQEAMAFLNSLGANLELQGRDSGAQSGRAIQFRMQQGLGQLGPLFDRIEDFELRVGRAIWARIQQYWTGPMYVRVTDDKNAAKFAAVNGAPRVDDRGQPMRRQMMTPNGAMMQPGGSDMHMMPNGQMMPGAYHGAPMAGVGHNGGPPIDPGEFETGPMLAELDMDIIIDRAQEAATLNAEQFEVASQMAQAGVFGPPGPELARLLVMWSAAPNKTELLEALDQIAERQKQGQQPNPMQVAQLKELEAKVEKLIAERDKTRAQTAQIGAEIPGDHADSAIKGAQARTETVNATMTEHAATRALQTDAMLDAAGAFNFVPARAAAEPGATGLPPTPANGPPP